MRGSGEESLLGILGGDDHFIAGVVAGWTNRALGTEREFDETKCVAPGDDQCVFESLEFLRPKKEFVE